MDAADVRKNINSGRFKLSSKTDSESDVWKVFSAITDDAGKNHSICFLQALFQSAVVQALQWHFTSSSSRLFLFSKCSCKYEPHWQVSDIQIRKSASTAVMQYTSVSHLL